MKRRKKKKIGKRERERSESRKKAWSRVIHSVAAKLINSCSAGDKLAIQSSWNNWSAKKLFWTYITSSSESGSVTASGPSLRKIFLYAWIPYASSCIVIDIRYFRHGGSGESCKKDRGRDAQDLRERFPLVSSTTILKYSSHKIADLSCSTHI